MRSPVFDVRPAAAGRWQVDQEGAASMLYDDKDAALTAAVELARLRPPGVVRVYGADGRVESEKTFTGAEAPAPSRDGGA